MEFIFIFLGLLFVVYLYKFNTRDKSKDFQRFNAPLVSNFESRFISDTNEAIDRLIEDAVRQKLPVDECLLVFKKNMLSDINEIVKDYKIDKFSARTVIDVCFDRDISSYSQPAIRPLSEFEKVIESEISQSITTKLLVSNYGNQQMLDFLKILMIEYFDKMTIYAKDYNLMEYQVEESIHFVFGIYIDSFSKGLEMDKKMGI